MRTDLSQTRRTLTLRYAQFSFVLLMVFGSAIYSAVADARGDLTRLQVQQLAATAAAELPLLEGATTGAAPAPGAAAGAAPVAGRTPLPEVIPLQSGESGQEHQRVRWFDAHLRPLAAYGDFHPRESLIPAGAALHTTTFLPLANGLALWRPVHLRAPNGAPPTLAGYVSVALATEAADNGLDCLRQGLLVGGGMAALVALLGGQWMVAVTLRPIRRQLDQLVRFTADASHELRNPLTAIRAVIGSLRQGGALQGSPPAVGEKLSLIDQTTERMARLVEDLLLLARSDRQLDDRSSMRSFPLEELIEDLTSLYAASAGEKGVVLTTAISGEARVQGHPERLRQLLVNLITNALRFTPPGGTVTVGLKLQGPTTQVWVDDQGPGIPPDQRELVFEPFWQADRARSGLGNAGLGLAIARAIAAAHRGSLVAAEAPGGGCRMLLGLPRQA